MRWIGKEFYKRFKDAGVTKIMTLEASGIPPAVMTAHYFGLPLVFVKKAKSSNLGNQNLYRAKIKSYTATKHRILVVRRKIKIQYIRLLLK